MLQALHQATLAVELYLKDTGKMYHGPNQSDERVICSIFTSSHALSALLTRRMPFRSLSKDKQSKVSDVGKYVTVKSVMEEMSQVISQMQDDTIL